MNKSRSNKQLELPVLTNINSKSSTKKTTDSGAYLQSKSVATDVTDFHKPASNKDQLIYNAISENYFLGIDKSA